MPVGDEKLVGSVSSHILDFAESKQSEDVLSAEDKAWLDSCLIGDQPEISESNWNSLKDALLDIFSSQPDLPDSSDTKGNDFPGEIDIEILPSVEEAETSNNPGNSFSNLAYETEENNGDVIFKKTDALRSRTRVLNDFPPNCSDDLKGNENINSSIDLNIPVFAVEPSTDDIFRVWDLDFPDEEDELIKQLEKALAEVPSSSDESGLWKDLKEQSLDDLISGVGDLSLK